ncbi:MAG: DUF4956 domain-containing protein [Oscillospiraceae bacterium]|nr:DUF4956 domain-containing protein [Oscillospiraceae bacterium]
MSFTDVIKNSVLEGFRTGDLSTVSMAVTLGMAVAMGLFIYVVYRLTAKGSFYNRDFNKSLATLPVITAGILLAMQSNLVISLGMVGALSIVRFRNAVKDPADLTFLFWSISMGIIVGAGLFELAVLLSLAATVLILGLDLIPTFRAPCMLVVSGESHMQEADLLHCVKSICPKVRIRSRNISKRGMEWILEVAVKDGGELVSRVAEINGVVSVNLMSHDGEVRF